MPIIFSDHAKQQLKRRGITERITREVVQNPLTILPGFRGRKLRRAKIGDKLLEVITRTEGAKITVITAYYLEE